ncbi:EamA family transporter [bacterium]|nr:EamA family transporter [bacterium]
MIKGTILLGFLAILLLTIAQTSLKYGLSQIGGFHLSRIAADIPKVFQTPWILIGFLFYGFSSLAWMDVLSKLDFSLALPMVSLTYVFSLIIGRFFFHETINMHRIAGVLLIICGIFFLVKSHITR